MTQTVKLARWAHPNGKTVRLYVNGFFAGALAGNKAWFEPNEKAKSGFVLKTSGEYQALASSNAALKRLIFDALALHEAVSWDDLLSQVGQGAPSRGRRTSVAEFGHQVAAPLQAGSRAEEAAHLDVASIKMLGPVTIRLDHREPAELGERLSTHALVSVEYAALELGDIEVEDREGNLLVIERKRCDESHTKTDFEVSVTDGRLFDQSERLKLAAQTRDVDIVPIVLLEGDLYRNARTMLCQQIDGAISFLSTIQRVSVIPALNLNHSLYIIAKLASHFVDGLYTPVTLHKTKPKALFEQQRYVLEALPGVSSKIAEQLLTHFSSVRAVMQADEKALLSVPGLGKKKVAELLKILDGTL